MNRLLLFLEIFGLLLFVLPTFQDGGSIGIVSARKANKGRRGSCSTYLSGGSTVQSGGATGVYKSGFKTRGGYYTSVNGISSVKECFDACVNDGGCSSFTYNASKGSCALSSRSGAASSSEAQSGGVRFCKDTRSTAGFVSSSNNSNNNNMPTSSSGKQITAADVAQHNSKSSAWTVVNGKVYDLTDFVNAHPGGSNAILRVAGRDGTSSFNGVRAHGSSERAVLQGYYIGDLASGTAGSGTLPAPAGGGGHDDDDDHGEGGHDDDHGEGGRDDEDDD